ncbi:hypothetical protein GCM10009416_48800 [Craurococcus roseus]|uniref:Uncharacterized protein n=1 Tax=Craurococcus roseus TaxID=77585 RepID=A0ABN1G7F8_9PROT
MVLLRRSITYRNGLGEETSKGSKPMSSTTFLLALGALVAIKIATRLGVDAGRFGDLPRPSQID